MKDSDRLGRRKAMQQEQGSVITGDVSCPLCTANTLPRTAVLAMLESTKRG